MAGYYVINKQDDAFKKKGGRIITQGDRNNCKVNKIKCNAKVMMI